MSAPHAPAPSTPLARALVFLALLVCLALALGWWWRQGTPVELPDATERLQCVSYAPFRKPEQSPFQKGLVIPVAQIDADFAVLARSAGCVRTYSVDMGLDAVPRIAKKHGLRVLLGVWIGSNPRDNEREILRAIEVAKRDRDAIEAIVVGNEVLLRRELPATTLATLIGRVRAETKLPVTYADVWEFWLKHPQIGQATDFVTIHILPYWEDIPIPVERAIEHVVAVHAQVQAAMPGRRLFIGETGWPSAGRNREGAQPGRVEQARFVREFVRAAETNGLRYNIVEAFDQPWKRRLEGTVGGYWGIYDQHLRAKFPFQGAVAEDPRWRRGFTSAAGGALFLVLVGIRARRGPLGLVTLAVAGATVAAVIAAQWRYMASSNRGFMEWAVGGTWTVFAVLAAAWLALALARWMDREANGAPVPPFAPVRDLTRWFVTNRSGFGARERELGALRFAFLFGAATVNLLLVFDPRYRDVPLALYLVPFVGFWLARLAGSRVRVGAEERVLAAVIAAAVPVILWHEGWANPHSLAWCGLSLAGAALVLVGKGHEAAEQPDR